MPRTIYTFYCYRCHHWQKRFNPIPHVASGHKLISVFCDMCHKQIPVEHTSLSPERYKIAFEGQWKIIDQDAHIPYIVFLCEDRKTTEQICGLLNNGIPTITFQDDISRIGDVWHWVVHNSSY